MSQSQQRRNRQLAEDNEALREENSGLRDTVARQKRKLAGARSVLIELRLRLQVQGRRPEECYDVSLIDNELQHIASPGWRET